jgi:hypothetical protein
MLWGQGHLEGEKDGFGVRHHSAAHRTFSSLRRSVGRQTVKPSNGQTVKHE